MFRVISVNAMTETVTNMTVSFAQVRYRLTLPCSKKQKWVDEIYGRQKPASSFSSDGGSSFKAGVIVSLYSIAINLRFQNNS